MNRIYAALLFFVLILTGCIKDAQIIDRDHPMIVTSLESDNESITFTGEILSEGKQQIIGYGFVYDKLYGKKFDSILFTGKPGNTFSITLQAGFVQSELYKLRAYVRTTENYIFGNQLEFGFNGSKPVELTGFSPSRGTTGDTVVIEGKYFSRGISGNIVKFGSDTAKVVLIEEGKLYVKVPELPVDQICQITVKTPSSISSLEGHFTRYYKWARILDNVPGNYDRGTKAGDYFVQFDNWTKTTMISNVKTGLSSQASQFPGSGYTYYDPVFSCVDMAYFICNGSKQLWQYKPETDEWTRKQDSPGHLLTYFKPIVIGSLAYFLYANNNTSQLWVYDAIADSWTLKPNEIDSPLYFELAFASEDKGYFCSKVGELIKLFEFDPDSGTIKYLTDYPGKGLSKLFGFYIDGKIYIGLGHYDFELQYQADDLWEFNTQTLKWEKSYPFPNYNGNRNYEIKVFSEDGYVTRHYYTSEFTEVYKLDPQKR